MDVGKKVRYINYVLWSKKVEFFNFDIQPGQKTPRKYIACIHDKNCKSFVVFLLKKPDESWFQILFNNDMNIETVNDVEFYCSGTLTKHSTHSRLFCNAALEETKGVRLLCLKYHLWN